jgi:hypothetical protein
MLRPLMMCNRRRTHARFTAGTLHQPAAIDPGIVKRPNLTVQRIPTARGREVKE